MIRRLGMIITVGLALTACSRDAGSYAYFLKNPNVALSTYKACMAKGDDSAECQNANRAVHRLASLQHELSLDPQSFGQKIIDAEIKLAKLKAAYKAAPNDAKAKAAYESQKLLIQTYMSVARISGE